MSDMVKHSIFIKCNKIATYSFHMVEERLGWHVRAKMPEKIAKCNPKDNEVICTIDIPMPLLAAGDDFFLEDVQEIVTIQQVMRTSKDNVAYVVSINIEDDLESLEKYEQELKMFLDKGEITKERDEWKVKYYELLNRNLFERIFNKEK